MAQAGRTAIVVKGYPRLSETFIAQEILGLQRRGQRQIIVSLRRPTDRAVHDLHRAIQAPVLYLPEYLHEAPAQVAGALAWARRRAGFGAAWRAFLRDLWRDRSRNRIRRFGQAAVLARALPADVDHLHCHYLHTPASVTRYAALMLGLPWSFSAHAKDIWTTPEWELREKLAHAAWGVTCTEANRAHLDHIDGGRGRVALVYHGLDFGRFPPPAPRPARDGSDPADPVRLLSVGRAVAKKGHDDLLAALARLPAGCHWRLVHIGGGALLDTLRAQASRLGLADRVEWRGARAADEVLAAYREADLFVLAAKIAADGDRDGLPNVLMEAQATGLCCLATRVSAIPELIDDGATGVLVAPGDAGGLADALAALIADPDRRRRLGDAGAGSVRRRFGFEAGLDMLGRRFGLAPSGTAACASPSTHR